MIKFEKEVCTDFQKSSCLEWLETNGIGGFASSTYFGGKHTPLSWAFNCRNTPAAWTHFVAFQV